MSNSVEKNRYYTKGTLIADVVIIGFVGGVIASFLGIVAKYFHFMQFSPKFIFTSWSNGSWIKTWQGSLMTILLFGFISIVFAFIYYLSLKKMRSLFSYIIFGLVCWLILFVAFKPIFKDLPAITKLSFDSIITSLCLFALYGVFIGYSISFDYQEYLKEQDRLGEETCK